MNDYFKAKEDKPVNSGNQDSHTNTNTGVGDDFAFNNEIENNNGTNQFKGNFDSMLEHFAEEVQVVEENPNQRRKPEVETSEPKGESEEETPEDVEGEGEEKTRAQNPEFYEQQGKFIADMTDIVLPKGIAYLNGQKGEDEKGIPIENQYKAESQLKKEIGLAWARVLEEKAVNLTPMQQLIWVNVMAYGLPLVLSVWSFIQKTMQKREAQDLAMMQTLQSMQKNATGPDSPPPPNPQQQKPNPEAKNADLKVVKEEKAQETDEPFFKAKEEPKTTDPVSRTIEQIRICETCEATLEVPDLMDLKGGEKIECLKCKGKGDEIQMGVDMKVCKHKDCQKSFEVGKGHAKTKGTKNFDSYCSKTCMQNEINTANQSNRKKK